MPRTTRYSRYGSQADSPITVIAGVLLAIAFINVTAQGAEIEAAPQTLEGKTELDAMIAYLQGLGIELKTRRQ